LPDREILQGGNLCTGVAIFLTTAVFVRDFQSVYSLLTDFGNTALSKLFNFSTCISKTKSGDF